MAEIRTVAQLAKKHGMIIREHLKPESYKPGSYDLTSPEYNVRIVYGVATRVVRGGIYDNRAEQPILFENDLAFIERNGLQPVIREIDKWLTTT